jgi:hypothetical protein
LVNIIDFSMISKDCLWFLRPPIQKWVWLTVICLVLSDIAFPKVITLSGAYCYNIYFLRSLNIDHQTWFFNLSLKYYWHPLLLCMPLQISKILDFIWSTIVMHCKHSLLLLFSTMLLFVRVVVYLTWVSNCLSTMYDRL